jgi:hypothetical protein
VPPRALPEAHQRAGHPALAPAAALPVPHGFLARTLGAGRGGSGYWLFAEGTLTAIIIAALGNTVASAPLFLVLLAALALSTGRPEGAR